MGGDGGDEEWGRKECPQCTLFSHYPHSVQAKNEQQMNPEVDHLVGATGALGLQALFGQFGALGAFRFIRIVFSECGSEGNGR